MSFPVESQTFGSYQWLLREVASALLSLPPERRAMAVGTEGMGLDRHGWSHEQFGAVDSIVQRGVMAFYTPAPLPGERYGHEWSFLRPNATLATIAEDYDYDLPSDFAMLDGPITYAPGAAVLYRAIHIVGEHQIRLRLSQAEFAGRPEWAAIRPKALSQTTGTRYEMLLWPVPNDAYTLHYPYRVNPGALTTTNNMPYGGQPHYETILASCVALAVPERAGEYQERLRASVSHDRRLASPRTLGYNQDSSDGVGGDHRDLQQNIVTYNGITY